MRKLLPLLLALAALVAGADAFARDDAPASNNSAPPAVQVRWARPALWRVKSGDTTVYLFGSMHILPGDIAWADPTIDAAMHESDVFVFEASLDANALLDVSNTLRAKGLLPRGVTLRSLLSPSGLARYNAVMKEIGMPPDKFDHFRPWLASLLIGMRHSSQRAITAPGSVDPTVMSYAQSHGREMRYFETAIEQMDVFGDMDRQTEVAVFESSLSEYDGRAARATELTDAWMHGDSEAVAKMLADEFAAVPAARRAILDDRNERFATKIEAFLRESKETFFVTVGAGHYGGRDGVIALLCDNGLHVMLVGRNGDADSPACGQTRGSISH